MIYLLILSNTSKSQSVFSLRSIPVKPSSLPTLVLEDPVIGLGPPSSSALLGDRSLSIPSTPVDHPLAACCSCQSLAPILCRCRPVLTHPCHPLVDPVPTYMTTLWRLSPERPSPWPALESQCRPRAVTPSVYYQLTTIPDRMNSVVNEVEKGVIETYGFQGSVWYAESCQHLCTHARCGGYTHWGVYDYVLGTQEERILAWVPAIRNILEEQRVVGPVEVLFTVSVSASGVTRMITLTLWI